MGAFTQGSIVDQEVTYTAGTTITMTPESPALLRIEGTTITEIILPRVKITGVPDTILMKKGRDFTLVNRSNNQIEIKDFNSDVVLVLYPQKEETLTLIDNTISEAGTWETFKKYDLRNPLQISENYPSPTSSLLITSNKIRRQDGSVQSYSPFNQNDAVIPDTRIDFQGGSVTGGTVRRDGLTFSLPNVTVGEFVRVVFTYASGDNFINCTFSPSNAVLANLENPATMFERISGVRLGYVDLESTGVSQFKTAGSTTNIIENENTESRIFTYTHGVVPPYDTGKTNYALNGDLRQGLTGWTSASGALTIALTNANRLKGVQSLQLDKDATAATSNDYVSCFLTPFDPLDQTKLIWVSFNYDNITPGNGVGDWDILIYDNVHSTLISPSIVQLPGGKGTYKYAFAPIANSNFYELRFYAKTPSRSLVVDSVKVWEQEQLVGIIPEPMNEVTSGTSASDEIYLQNMAAFSTFFVSRFGDRIKIKGSFNINFVAGVMRMTMADKFSRDPSKSPGNYFSSDNDVVGTVRGFVGGTNFEGTAQFEGSSLRDIVFLDASGNPWDTTTPVAWSSSDYVTVEIEYPIINGDVPSTLSTTETYFVFNTDVSDADDTTSFGQGVQGNPVPVVSTTNKRKRVRFLNGFILPEQVVIELVPPNSNFGVDSTSIFPRQNIGGADYGIWFEPVGGSNTDLDLIFAASGGDLINTWAALNSAGWRYRVKKPGHIGLGKLIEASRFNSGYTTTGPQDFAGPKSWYNQAGTQLIIGWDDAGNITIPGTVNGNSGIIPVGGVIPIFSNLAGSYTLPASGVVSPEGWMRCDGAAIPGGNALSGNTPDITNSRFIMGTDGSGTGAVPNDDPISGTTGGSNAFTIPTTTVSWNPVTVNTTFTDSAWSGSGTFSRIEFDSAQTPHSHDISTHTHNATHSHLMRHAHQFAIWNYNGANDFTIQFEQNSTYNYNQIDLDNPEDVIANVNVTDASTGQYVAQVVDQVITSDTTFYTAGVVGENGDGNVARTANEPVVTTGSSISDTGTESISFTGTQNVTVVGTNSSGSATFDKTVMNADQIPHGHSVADTRPSFISAIYLIRVN